MAPAGGIIKAAGTVPDSHKTISPVQVPASAALAEARNGGSDLLAKSTSPPSSSVTTHNGASIGDKRRRESLASAVSEEALTSAKEIELQRKRARDRKSQQAMRDRNKWTIQTLGEQVAYLNSTLEDRTRDIGVLEAKVTFLEGENAQLRTQNAALQLSLLGREGTMENEASPGAASASSNVSSLRRPPWELPINNGAPGGFSDQILAAFVTNMRASLKHSPSAELRKKHYYQRPLVSSLVDKEHRQEDAVSNVVADVILTYNEIIQLPKQVAAFYMVALLLKWLIVLDKPSWERLPDWLRPVPSQITITHQSWIDRIPWPRSRTWLIAHPEISLDEFVLYYSAEFDLSWPYDPSTVVLNAGVDSNGISTAVINPVFEEHLLQIKNWRIGDNFRERFPELSKLIDLDTGHTAPSTGISSQTANPQDAETSPGAMFASAAGGSVTGPASTGAGGGGGSSVMGTSPPTLSEISPGRNSFAHHSPY